MAFVEQEIFNTVVRHARKQGCQAFAIDGLACRYRGANGTKCFIGALIPDELYDPVIEGMGANSLQIDESLDTEKFKAIMRSAIGVGSFQTDQVRFLIDLQNIHDKFHPGEWDEKFQGFADKYHLEVPDE